MSDRAEYLGYIRATPGTLRAWKARPRNTDQADAEEVWQLTDQKSLLLDAEIGDVLLLPEDAPYEFLTNWLQERWPSEYPDYGRVVQWPLPNYRNESRYGVPVEILVLPYERFLAPNKSREADPERVAALAQQLAPRPLLFEIGASWLPWDKSVRNVQTGRYIYFSEIEKYGCYVRCVERELAGTSRWVQEIVYNPKVTARRARKREAVQCQNLEAERQVQAQQQLLNASDVVDVARGLYYDLPDWTRSGLELPYPISRIDSIDLLRSAIAYYDGCHRRTGAHRRFEPFQRLVRRWRDKYVCQNTKAKWPKRMNKYQVAKFETFCAFMDQAAKRRLPPVGRASVHTLQQPW